MGIDWTSLKMAVSTYVSTPYLADSKPFFQRHLQPVAEKLAKLGVTANQVTLATMLVSVITGSTVMIHNDEPSWLLLIPIALCVRLVNNHVDGMLATAHGMKTPLGGMLNELADVVSDACIYLPMAAFAGISSPLVVCVVTLGIVSEVAGISATTIGASRRMDGPLSKKPRGIMFGLIALLLSFGIPPGSWVSWLLWLMVMMSFLTILNRIVGACVEAT